MFSKKVEEYDDLKMQLSTKEKEVKSLVLEKGDLTDFKTKYQRECAQREDLYQRYCQLNESLESQARTHQDRVDVILREKGDLI
jgi:hypothetical protein